MLLLMIPRPPTSTLFPYTTLFRSPEHVLQSPQGGEVRIGGRPVLNLCANNYLGLASDPRVVEAAIEATRRWGAGLASDRKSTRLNSSHVEISYAVFCLKKKKKKTQ